MLAAAAAPHRRRRLVDGAAVARPCRRSIARAARGHGAGAAAAAGAVRRLHAVAARCWATRATPTSALARQLRTGPRRSTGCRISSSCRPTGRGPRWRAIAAAASRSTISAALHRRLVRARARDRREPVHGAAGRAGGAADPARRRRRHRRSAVPIAGRTDAALDDLVGFFVNTLVLRTDTRAIRASASCSRGCARGNLAAYAHQDLPFERLVEVLNPARSLSRHPLFQVMLVFAERRRRRQRSSCPGSARRPQPVATASAKFDLSLALAERARRTARRPASTACWNTPPTCSTSDRRGARRSARAAAGERRPPTPDRALGSIDILDAGRAPHASCGSGTTTCAGRRCRRRARRCDAARAVRRAGRAHARRRRGGVRGRAR